LPAEIAPDMIYNRDEVEDSWDELEEDIEDAQDWLDL
jgi:hypothetical protein